MVRLPVGITDFKEVRNGDYYYVDKTEFISKVTDNFLRAVLFSRPNGFGKSLNLSMLDAFFNIKYKGNTWFDGLRVSNDPDMAKHKNEYPVIHLDLKNINTD